ncbi:MAG TPA: zinc ribbon domain-containing protein [Candidatus Bathyarchaeia archaeon]|nr:zinc ribbon domain-containing protein [Candidatus Bathyarchaeia archaeon]
MSEAFDERMKLIRFRRKRERFRLREEIRIVPKRLVWTCVVLWLLAIAIGTLINLSGVNGETFPPDLAGHPVLASLALAGITTLISAVTASWLMALGYVYRDARRRGMNGGLWLLLCMLLSWPFFAIGFILYFQVREPLPFPCPRCSTMVGARFNFCPNCKCNLHPSCPNCKREVAETDKFCPYCGQDLAKQAEAPGLLRPAPGPALE